MRGSVRLLVVTSLALSLVVLPCSEALAAGQDEPAAPAPSTATGRLFLERVTLSGDADAKNRRMWGTALGFDAAQPPEAARVLNQVVASTSHHNFILGATAAALVVGGVALISYSTTPTCKQGLVSAPQCDRDKVLGAVGISAGAIMLVLWGLSK